MTQNNTTLSLTSDWIDSSVTPTITNSANLSVFSKSAVGYCYRDYWYPYYQPITTIYTTEPRRPIRLTMSEVERLRVAAKKDKALKNTLAKFTEHIEVVVDFGE